MRANPWKQRWAREGWTVQWAAGAGRTMRGGRTWTPVTRFCAAPGWWPGSLHLHIPSAWPKKGAQWIIFLLWEDPGCDTDLSCTWFSNHSATLVEGPDIFLSAFIHLVCFIFHNVCEHRHVLVECSQTQSVLWKGAVFSTSTATGGMRSLGRPSQPAQLARDWGAVQWQNGSPPDSTDL